MTNKLICIYIVFLLLVTFIFGKFGMGPLAKSQEKTDTYITKFKEKIKREQRQNVSIIDESPKLEASVIVDQFEEKKGFDADTAILDMTLRTGSPHRTSTVANRNLQHSVVKEDFAPTDRNIGMSHNFGN
jgi:hypothetical protein